MCVVCRSGPYKNWVEFNAIDGDGNFTTEDICIWCLEDLKNNKDINYKSETHIIIMIDKEEHIIIEKSKLVSAIIRK